MRKGELVRSRTVDSRPSGRRAAVEDQVDPAVEVVEDVLGQVGEMPFDRFALGAAIGLPGVRSGRRATSGDGTRSADGLPAAGHDVGDQARSRQDQGQAAWPEPPGELVAPRPASRRTQVRACRPRPAWTISGLNRGPPLGLEDPWPRPPGSVAIGAEAVDGLGREGHEAAASEDLRGLVERRPASGRVAVDRVRNVGSCNGECDLNPDLLPRGGRRPLPLALS